MQLPYYSNIRLTNIYGAAAPAGVTYSAGYHTGIDLVGDSSKQILAVADGIVFKTGYDQTGWGNYIVILQLDGLYAIYCHLTNKFAITGEAVPAGTIIGTEGSTGQVTGSHLHIEFRKDYYDKYSTVNAADYLGIKNEVGDVEELEVKTEITILLDGTEKTVEAIQSDGYNYVKLQDLRCDNIVIDYDETKKQPIVTVL